MDEDNTWCPVSMYSFYEPVRGKKKKKTGKHPVGGPTVQLPCPQRVRPGLGFSWQFAQAPGVSCVILLISVQVRAGEPAAFLSADEVGLSQYWLGPSRWAWKKLLHLCCCSFLSKSPQTWIPSPIQDCPCGFGKELQLCSRASGSAAVRAES